MRKWGNEFRLCNCKQNFMLHIRNDCCHVFIDLCRGCRSYTVIYQAWNFINDRRRSFVFAKSTFILNYYSTCTCIPSFENTKVCQKLVNNINNQFLYSAFHTQGCLKALPTPGHWVFMKFLKLSQLPGEYTACATKCALLGFKFYTGRALSL